MNWFNNLFVPQKVQLIEKDRLDTQIRFEHLRKLTKQLDESELEMYDQYEQLKIVVNDLNTAIWAKNTKGIFKFVNKACADKILKVSVEDALNMTEFDFKNDALSATCLKTDQIVMDTIKTHRFIEYANYGSEFMCIDSVKSPWIKDNKLVGTVGSGKDITNFIPDYIKKQYCDSGFIEIDINLFICKEKLNEIFKV